MVRFFLETEDRGNAGGCDLVMPLLCVEEEIGCGYMECGRTCCGCIVQSGEVLKMC